MSTTGSVFICALCVTFALASSADAQPPSDVEPPSDAEAPVDREAWLAELDRETREMVAHPPVHVNDEQCDDDPVGRRIAYRVREGIRASQAGVRLVGQSDHAVLRVSIVCITPKREDAGVVSTYSWMITAANYECGPYGRMYLAHGVQICGADRVAGCAENLLAALDEELLAWSGWANELLE